MCKRGCAVGCGIIALIIIGAAVVFVGWPWIQEHLLAPDGAQSTVYTVAAHRWHVQFSDKLTGQLKVEKSGEGTIISPPQWFEADLKVVELQTTYSVVTDHGTYPVGSKELWLSLRDDQAYTFTFDKGVVVGAEPS